MASPNLAKAGANCSPANDRLAISMAVDPEHERRRVQLMKEQDTLQKALEKLESLSTSDLAG